MGNKWKNLPFLHTGREAGTFLTFSEAYCTAFRPGSKSQRLPNRHAREPGPTGEGLEGPGRQATAPYRADPLLAPRQPTFITAGKR
ncbi:hypothetical protein SKAU_G00089100 [Synaphobranchus kaupii]|uniref:Uncharacterized protein n=1 Tax=Synaphobranchus kaupii TaxID=118154 RepID=A0A9Q1J582_SYNKA|nr:hypothetical protein SKAU_G00089100 [Synaphobranchus kaupii]